MHVIVFSCMIHDRGRRKYTLTVYVQFKLKLICKPYGKSWACPILEYR